MDVRLWEVWEDQDTRARKRHLLVTELKDGTGGSHYAMMRSFETERTTRVQTRRLDGRYYKRVTPSARELEVIASLGGDTTQHFGEFALRGPVDVERRTLP